MGRSRYASSEVIDSNHYGTWSDPTTRFPLGPDILDGIQTVQHVLVLGERLDILATTYYGDPDYWWVIALCNRIVDPFSLVPGQVLRIATNVRSILDLVQR
jgi:nucleoid-associated protein YgaU